MDLLRLRCGMLGLALLGCVAAPATAETVNYNFTINIPGGSPMENIVLYAAGQGQDSIELLNTPVTSGAGTLSQTVPFEVERSLIVGMNTSDKDHIILFSNLEFADSAVGRKWSEVFTAPSPRHNEFVTLLKNAHGGDAVALDAVSVFLRGDQMQMAAFSPDGAYSVVQFTTGTIIPEPATLALLGIGGVGLMFRRRR